MQDNEVTDSIYAFRVSKKDKEWLAKEIKALKTLVNKSRAKGTRVINKNDIIIEALRFGFDRIRSKAK